jgi:hypothetical protein
MRLENILVLAACAELRAAFAPSSSSSSTSILRGFRLAPKDDITRELLVNGLGPRLKIGLYLATVPEGDAVGLLRNLISVVIAYHHVIV